MRFELGLRCSRIDLAVLTIALIAAYSLYPSSALMAFVIVFVAAHFFVYCSLIRLPRSAELLWAGALFFVAALHAFAGTPSVPVAATICALLGIILGAIHTRHPSYHGIFWQRLNPGLRDWFEARNRTSNAGSNDD